jgi:UDP-glucuronate 4-epimerase
VKRALVTGCAGFVGSHLCERLTADGWRVTGVDAFTPYYERTAKEANLAVLAAEPRFDLVELDVAEADLAPLLADAAVVFHLAAQPGVRASFGDGFARYVHDNVLATQRLLEAASDAGCSRFVWASSSSVYGDAAEYPCSEARPRAPRSPYGVTKATCEDLAAIYRNRGLCTVALRYFTVYGPRQRPDMAMRRLCEALVAGTPFPLYGDGSQSRDFTFVADAVDATVRAGLAREPAAVYNVGGGEEATLAEVIAALEECVGARIELDRRPVQPGDVRRTGADTSRARADLGWQPVVSIRDGLALQAGWVAETTGRASATSVSTTSASCSRKSASVS